MMVCTAVSSRIPLSQFYKPNPQFYNSTQVVKTVEMQLLTSVNVVCETFTCVGDFFSCRLGLTLRKPLAARDELLASPFLRPSVTLRDRQESGDKVNNINVTPCSGLWHIF